jgi:hypothetical protein
MHQLSSQNRRSILAHLVALGLLFGSATWAAQGSSAEVLRSLVRVKTMQNYTEMTYEVYLRNCRQENPQIEDIIARHRQRDSALYLRLDVLIAKYRAQVTKDLGSTEANRAFGVIADEQRKVDSMLREATERDEKLHKFECIKEPAALPGVPADVRAEIEHLEH